MGIEKNKKVAEARWRVFGEGKRSLLQIAMGSTKTYSTEGGSEQ